MRSHHFWLSATQFSRLGPVLPKKMPGVSRVDDRPVNSGIIHVLKNGLMWWNAPAVCGAPKMPYNRFIRWSKAGVFEKFLSTLADMREATGKVMIDATHLKVHRNAANLLKKARASIGFEPAHRGVLGATRRSNTKSNATSSAIGSNACLMGSRTGTGSQHDTTAAPAHS